MRVRLSQLRDGSLLGITFAHVVTGKQGILCLHFHIGRFCLEVPASSAASPT